MMAIPGPPPPIPPSAIGTIELGIAGLTMYWAGFFHDFCFIADGRCGTVSAARAVVIVQAGLGAVCYAPTTPSSDGQTWPETTRMFVFAFFLHFSKTKLYSSIYLFKHESGQPVVPGQLCMQTVRPLFCPALAHSAQHLQAGDHQLVGLARQFAKLEQMWGQKALLIKEQI